MKISKIEIKNFKSFKDISVDLNDFNVIIGKSASGKTNFIEAFDLLKNISEDFENGIYEKGGLLFKNFSMSRNTPSCIKATIGDGKPFISMPNPIENKQVFTMVKYTSIEYELCINFENLKLDYFKEFIKLNFNIYDEDSKLLSQNALILKNLNGEVLADFENKEKFADLEFFIPNSLLNIVNNNFKENPGLLINSPLSAVPISWSNYFRNINCYNFDPTLGKMLGNKNNVVLSKHGENLPYILDSILSDEDNKRKFINLVSILLPYVKDIEISQMNDDKKIFGLIESYNKLPIYEPFISDGTFNIIALICALYFSKKEVILIEEPERNIHPGLFMQLVGMMKEISSKDKQIIITTHNPEILNNCDLEDILFISRDNDGFSTLSKLGDNENIKEFLQELTIGELFIEGFLGEGNE